MSGMWDEEKGEYVKDAVLGVIKRPVFGCIDGRPPALRFTLYTNEHLASFQVIHRPEEYNKIFMDAEANDVSDLDGKAAWVRDGGVGGIMEFLRIAKIG